MKRLFVLLVACLVAIGCASSGTKVVSPRPPPANTVAPKVDESVPDMPPPNADEAKPPAPEPATVSMGVEVPRPEEWLRAPADGTPFDVILINRKTHAMVMIMSGPSGDKSVADIAKIVRDGSPDFAKNPPTIKSDPSGNRASFAFNDTNKKGEAMKGKVIALRRPELPETTFVLIGRWPAKSDKVAAADLEAIASSLKVKAAKPE